MSDFIEIALISKILLRWYVKNGRVLPWRASPKDSESGQTLDPYRDSVSEITLQHTTGQTVIP